MSFDVSWENNIYAKGKQLNRYPYGDLVSLFYHTLRCIKNVPKIKNQIKVLEVGSGAGNNLFFFLREGFDAYGLEGSKSACILAENFLKQEGLVPKIINGTFSNMPFADNTFDIVVDRESTCCGTFNQRKLWWKNIYNIMKPGGAFLSFSFSTENPFCQLAEKEQIARKIGTNTFKDFKYGTFSGTGIVNFLDKNSMRELYQDFEIIKSYNHLLTPLDDDGNDNDTFIGFGEFINIGIKK